jgi:predicted Zn-dependent protease
VCRGHRHKGLLTLAVDVFSTGRVLALAAAVVARHKQQQQQQEQENHEQKEVQTAVGGKAGKANRTVLGENK